MANFGNKITSMFIILILYSFSQFHIDISYFLMNIEFYCVRFASIFLLCDKAKHFAGCMPCCEFGLSSTIVFSVFFTYFEDQMILLFFGGIGLLSLRIIVLLKVMRRQISRKMPLITPKC